MSRSGKRSRGACPAAGTSKAGEGRTTASASSPTPSPSPSEETPRRVWILLGAVVFVATAFVAGAFTPSPHTGGDNAAYLTLGYSLLHGSYAELFDPAHLPHTKYPPVFPALLAVLMAVGVRTWAAFKTVAAVSTVAAVAFTYLWAQRRLGAVWAAGVALLVAASSAVVYYSHWILSDPTFLAFTLLALWALERADRGGETTGEEAGDQAAKGSADRAGTRWLALGVVAAGLAYFTRSAGLPLVVALLAWLALRKRWRALAASAAGLGVPMLLWMLRARGAGQGEYVSEFWLVNPYDPSLGRVGVGGLVGRVFENLGGYLGSHIPGGIVGSQGPMAGVLGVVLAVAAVAGWVVALRRRPGPAELFFPLYAGLILLWPAVWSGDRFALPLYPLLFLYAAGGIRAAAAWRGRAGIGGAVAAAAFVAVLLPAAGAWTRSVQDASACGALVRQRGPFACYGAGVASFVEAAGWAGANLPEGSVVLSRKPRMFYVLSGLPSRTFPFSDDPAAHLELADAVGARFELFDRWDGLASRYVAGAVGRQPKAFCAARSFGEGGGTVLLGIVPPEARTAERTTPGEQVQVPVCGADFGIASGEAYASPSSSRIPLLDRPAS